MLFALICFTCITFVVLLLLVVSCGWVDVCLFGLISDSFTCLLFIVWVYNNAITSAVCFDCRRVLLVV